jgi:hypothetical protein
MVFAIDVGLLFEVVWASALAGGIMGAGAVVSVLFALVVLFGARSAETRRAGNGAAAMAYGAAAAVAFSAFAFLVGYAVHLMLSKG